MEFDELKNSVALKLAPKNISGVIDKELFTNIMNEQCDDFIEKLKPELIEVYGKNGIVEQTGRNKDLSYTSNGLVGSSTIKSFFQDVNTIDGFYHGDLNKHMTSTASIEEFITHLEQYKTRINNKNDNLIESANIMFPNTSGEDLLNNPSTHPFFNVMRRPFIRVINLTPEYTLEYQGRLMIDCVIMWKFVTAWYLGNHPELQEQFPDLRLKPLELNNFADNKEQLTNYLTNGSYKGNKPETYPPHILKDLKLSMLNYDSKVFVRKINFSHILKILLMYDLKYFCCDFLDTPLAIYHTAFICNYEALVGGYRGMLWLHHKINQVDIPYKDIIRTTLSTCDKSIATDDKINNTLNDSLFILTVIASFMNCPSITMFCMDWLVHRVHYMNYLPYDYKTFTDTDDWRALKRVTINMPTTDGYLLPIWPYKNDYDEVYPVDSQRFRVINSSDTYPCVLLCMTYEHMHLSTVFIDSNTVYDTDFLAHGMAPKLMTHAEFNQSCDFSRNDLFNTIYGGGMNYLIMFVVLVLLVIVVVCVICCDKERFKVGYVIRKTK